MHRLSKLARALATWWPVRGDLCGLGLARTIWDEQGLPLDSYYLHISREAIGYLLIIEGETVYRTYARGFVR
jgi:hypothetical protein